jgi:rare lipoprotein A
VTNLRNGRSIIVRVNDRGPYHAGRVMDVSSRVADVLDFKRYGMAKVRVDYVGPASLSGSDDTELLATLRTGGPAQFAGAPDATVAGAAPALPFGSLIRRARGVVVAAAPTAQPQPPETSVAVEAAAAPSPAPIRADYAPADAPLPPRRPYDIGLTSGAEAPGARLRQTSAIYYTHDRQRRREDGDPAYDALPERRPSYDAAPSQ